MLKHRYYFCPKTIATKYHLSDHIQIKFICCVPLESVVSNLSHTHRAYFWHNTLVPAIVSLFPLAKISC